MVYLATNNISNCYNDFDEDSSLMDCYTASTGK
jgi:hypothetical protein